MKVLVLGATGMVGHAVALYFKEAGHNVVAYSRRKFRYCENIIGDVKNFEYIRNIIDTGKFDIVVNAVGILNSDAEKNKSEAILINSYLPHYLSEITKESKTKIVHISTDCVFSGTTGGYLEGALRDGKSFYSRTKSLGEIENNKDLTFRNSIIGPDMNEKGLGLLNWFMKQNDNVIGYRQCIWNGVTNLTLAMAIEEGARENLSGIYNLVNNEVISKFELLNLFNKYIGNRDIDILPEDSVVVNKTLINNRKDFKFKVPTYENMIISLNKWINNHKEIYEHYFD